ncbi:MAG: Rieske 2Fe-2S domain-containing protein [Chloroflexi bacterium]|nr:Rieske 2Fe-2S domain-containing protein [Chloroflexota bacterium]
MTAWHEIGLVGVCTEGQLREFKVSDQVVLLWCHDGEFHAVQGICPHMKVHLAKGKVDGTVITCPGHGSRFDLITGEVVGWLETLHGPAKAFLERAGKRQNLVVYPVKVVDKRVMVQF